MKFSKITAGTCIITFFSLLSTFPAFAAAKNHDGEIIAYMEAIDNHEVDVSKVAKDKQIDKQTMDFADMMISQHGDNLQQLKDISSKINVSADETSAVEKFKKNGEKDLENLSKLNGKKFQSAYIHAMIKGHTEADNMIAKFEKEVSNADLKQYLVDTKTAVEQHLAEAKKLK